MLALKGDFVFSIARSILLYIISVSILVVVINVCLAAVTYIRVGVVDAWGSCVFVGADAEIFMLDVALLGAGRADVAVAAAFSSTPPMGEGVRGAVARFSH
jgi:hypothetical protein